jgi:hypothetical protein
VTHSNRHALPSRPSGSRRGVALALAALTLLAAVGGATAAAAVAGADRPAAVGTDRGDQAGDAAAANESSTNQSSGGDSTPTPERSDRSGNESGERGNRSGGTDDAAASSVAVAATGPPELAGAVELSASRAEQVGSNSRTESVIELSFTAPVRHALEDRPLRASDVVVRVDERNVTDRYVLDDDGSAGPGSTNAGQVVLSAGERVEPGDDLTVALPSLAGPDGEVGDVGTVDVSVTDETAAESAGDSNENTDEAGVFPGAPVAVVADDGESDLDNPIDVRTRAGRYVGEESTGTNSQVYLFETTDRDRDAHYQFDFTDDAGGDADGNVVQLTFFELNLTATLDETALNPGDTLRGELNARDAPRPVRLTLDGPGDNVTRETTLALPASEPTDFAFGPLEDRGDYEVVVNDTLTDRRFATETVTVAEGDVVLNADVYADERGDVVSVPVEVRRTGTATVVVGSEDVGYEATVVLLDDDGDDRVTLQWNTYLADGPEDGVGEAFSVGDDDDRIRVESVRSDIAGGDADEPEVVEAGTYDLFVRSGASSTRSTSREPEDVAIVELGPRATTSASVLAVAGEVAPDVEDASDLREARRTGNLTRTDEVTTRDVLVFQVNASGIAGVFEGSDDDAERLIDRAPPLAVRFEQVDAFNERPVELRIESNDARLVEDRAGDAYYLFVDVGGLDTVPADLAGTADADVEAEPLRTDTRFEGNFTLRGDGGLAETDESVVHAFDVVEPEFDVSEGVELPVTANGDIVVSVPTTLAPGTEVDVRLRADTGSGGSFLKTARTRVARSGRVTVTLSGRDAQLGERVTLSLDAGGTSTTVEGFVGGPGTATVPPATSTPTAVVVTIPEPTVTPTATPGTDATETTASSTGGGVAGGNGSVATASSTGVGASGAESDSDSGSDPTRSRSSTAASPSRSSSPGFGVVLAVVAVVVALVALRPWD